MLLQVCGHMEKIPAVKEPCVIDLVTVKKLRKCVLPHSRALFPKVL